MQPFTYLTPGSAEEAVAAYAEAGEGAVFVAGGTNLYDLMKLGIARPSHLIDVTGIEGLDTISTEGEELRFGANAKMSAVAAHDHVAGQYPVLSESLWKAAAPQLRNMATVGANLLQRTRCLYFRNGAGSVSTVGVYPCNKRAPGSGCAAIGGLDRGQAVLGTSEACTAVSPGDWPVALTALDASVEVLGRDGARRIPITEFYRLPGSTPDVEFALAPGEIVTAVTVPRTEAGRRSTYHKLRDRASYAFALASAAVALEMEGETVRRARIALGGVATVPWRASGVEAALAGRRLSRDLALEAARGAFAEARPGRQNGFKIDLGAQTLADALMIAMDRA
ncbi:MAG: xanthine dehydrogenase family protein subunit M [Rhodobacteraceae bacterium]|nr:xanthine dehydrogenase family protein subunit M [Paracoccaceae bacterium]MBR9822848.1 xanthine dehydrogenase family protein subunit M [Paracoccaceae bacterium]